MERKNKRPMRIKLGSSEILLKGLPMIGLPDRVSTIDSVVAVIRKLIEGQEIVILPRPTPRSRRGKRRWPLDLLRASGGGIMALRVQNGAGLEPYGISDLDVLLVSFDDPTPGEPAMVAIDGKVVFGWFTRKGRRVRIEPLAGDAPPVETDAGKIQVACALKGIVRWLGAESSIPVRKEHKTDSNRVHLAS